MGNRTRASASGAKAGIIGAAKALAVELATRAVSVLFSVEAACMTRQVIGANGELIGVRRVVATGVTGEGAVILVLDERERALALGATIPAEIVGYATNCDGLHVSQPSESTQINLMQLALDA